MLIHIHYILFMGHVRSSKLCRCKLPPKNRCETGGCKVISHKENTIWIVSWGYEASTWKNDKRKKNDNAWKHHLIDIGVFRQPHIVKNRDNFRKRIYATRFSNISWHSTFSSKALLEQVSACWHCLSSLWIHRNIMKIAIFCWLTSKFVQVKSLFSIVDTHFVA